MPSGQALIDLLAQGISTTGASLPTYAVDETVLRRYLEPETAAIAATATRAGPHSPHFRADTGAMTVGGNPIPTVVLIGADGLPGYADPMYSLFQIPSGGNVTLAPKSGDGMILIAIGGKGTPGAEGGNASVRGGSDCLCIALGGQGGQGVWGSVALFLAGTPGIGGTGGKGGDASTESADGCDLFSFSGNGGQGGTGAPGIDLTVQMSTMALQPNPSNSPILSLPSAGGNGGAGGPGGFSSCLGRDGCYANAAAGDGGAPGDGGPGGKGGTAYAGTPSAVSFADGGQGRGGTGGQGGDTHAIVGANGNAVEQPGRGGQPGASSGPGATPGRDGSPL